MGGHAGRSIQSLTEDLISKRVDIKDLPPLVVARHMGKLWALTGNRRLHAAKACLQSPRARGPLKIKCLVHDLDSGAPVPPELVAKFISASTTRNDGLRADLRTPI